MEIEPVQLNGTTADWLRDLCLKSIQLAKLSKEIANAYYYDVLVPEMGAWDRANRSRTLSDPLRNSLKVQRFVINAGNDLLLCASYSASNSLSGAAFHPYTPLSTGVLCRSAVEQLLYSYYLLGAESPEELTARVYRIYVKGIEAYKWSKFNASGRASMIGIYTEWAEGRNIPKGPKYNPSALLDKIIDFDDSPYSYLSDFVHGNPVTTSMSVIDIEEGFGTNRQHDYWCLAIAFQTSLATIKAYGEKYPHVVSSEHSRALKQFDAFSMTFSLRAVESWGVPKRIPDRDYE